MNSTTGNFTMDDLIQQVISNIPNDKGNIAIQIIILVIAGLNLVSSVVKQIINARSQTAAHTQTQYMVDKLTKRVKKNASVPPLVTNNTEENDDQVALQVPDNLKASEIETEPAAK